MSYEKKSTIAVYKALKSRLSSDSFKEQYRLSEEDFTRTRIFTFLIVMLTILNNISRSLGVELTKFLTKFGSGDVGSKQAFSQARHKIQWEAFTDLNDTLISTYYSQGEHLLYKDKYLLLATDGSDYELPWEADLVTEFGAADNKITKQPICMAKGVKIWDALNKMTVKSYLGHYDVAEIQHFKTVWQQTTDLLATIPQVCNTRLLLLADMHYPSFWLFYALMNAQRDFLFRCPPSFCRETIAFMATDESEAMLKITINGDKHRRSMYKKQTGLKEVPEYIVVRALKYVRPNGEISCLVTSIPSKELDFQNIVNLYPYRWTEEVSYNFDKNSAEIENFSSKTPLGIRQDWYASTLSTNMAQLLIHDAQELLNEEQKDKNNKHEYQINQSVALGILKDEIPKMLFGNESPTAFKKRMIPLILRHRVPIRPNRSYPREKKHKLKFSMNFRRCL